MVLVLKVPADTEQMIMNIFINYKENSSKVKILKSSLGQGHVFRHVLAPSMLKDRGIIVVFVVFL